MLIFHILFVDNLNAEQLFCGSSYRSSLFQQQHLRKSLYLPRVVTDTAAAYHGRRAYGLKDFSTVFTFASCFAVTAGNFRYFIPNVGVTGWARDDCKVASKFNG